MALSNRARVGDAFDLLASGLRPYVDRRMRAAQPRVENWLAEYAKRATPPLSSDATANDPSVLLRVMADRWDDLFRSELGRTERNLVFELRDVRNGWAHNKPFTVDDAYRALDSIERVLTAIDATQAEEVGRSKDDLMRLRYEDQTRKALAKADPSVTSAVPGLAAWRDVVVPHDDVTSHSRLSLAEFAADLYQVRAEKGRAEYVDPVEFFRRTYLTVGLRQLLAQAVTRVSALDEPTGVPVVDLQTTFGGGKTHSMIALYHLFGNVKVSALPQEIQELCSSGDAPELPEVRRVVIVGNQLSPGQPSTKPDGTVVRTMWGELAWQLGGADGYAFVADADRTGTNPGDNLRLLLAAYSPCLILIDEWVAYARELLGKDDLAAGTFDTHFSFAQALTESVRATAGALLVVSIPASQRGELDGSDADRDVAGSEREVGGSGGREALRRLRNVVGRMESSWRPATSEESFAIVQRRLFQPIDPQKLPLRDATARAFADLYQSQGPEFPADARHPDYEAKIRAAYPIHPELFDVLYEDWSTLDRFQRTRGVLRLMATAIHVLWHADDQSPLILPGSLPLDDAGTMGELTRNLDDNWQPIIDTDVDGPSSMSRSLDNQFKNLGQYGAARRVARTVFFASAPRSGRGGRGIDAARVRLGCALPKQTVSVYGDALARLADRATYLYGEDASYWFGTQPGVTRLARDYADRLMTGQRGSVHAAIVKRLVAATRLSGQFAEVHVAPSGPGLVTDTAEVRLVVLPPDVTHVQRSEDSGAWATAKSILASDGSGTRDYPNMLVFLAPDHAALPDLEQAVAEELAWAWVEEQASDLGLSLQQVTQTQTRRTDAERASGVRLASAYRWMLVPSQPDPIGPISFDVFKVDGAAGLAVRAANRLVAETKMFTVYPPVLLRALLNGLLAPEWTDGHVSVKRLWDLIATYVYLPRLASVHVLEETARNAPASTSWGSESFTCADGYDSTAGRYLGLSSGGSFATATTSTLLVRPDVADAQLTRERAVVPVIDGRGVAPVVPPGTAVPDVSPRWSGRPVTDFAASVRLANDALPREFRRVVDEVVSHLLAEFGSEVEVRLEIRAERAEGFPDDVRRVVAENLKHLGFEDGSGFVEADAHSAPPRLPASGNPS